MRTRSTRLFVILIHWIFTHRVTLHKHYVHPYPLSVLLERMELEGISMDELEAALKGDSFWLQVCKYLLLLFFIL